MTDDNYLNTQQQKNMKLHANIEKLMRENNVEDLAFLSPLNEDNKPQQTLPPSLTRHKNEFQSKLESINKVKLPSKVELKLKRLNADSNRLNSLLPKEASPRKQLVIEEENKKLKMEVDNLNRMIDSLKKSITAKDQERKELSEEFKDKERRMFKDHDSNLARLKREYDHRIQNLQLKIDEKSEKEVQLSHRLDRIKEESLVKDSIIQKLNEEVVKKENDYKKLMDNGRYTKESLGEDSRGRKFDDDEEELYQEQNDESCDQDTYLDVKARLEAKHKRNEAIVNHVLIKNESDGLDDDANSISGKARSTRFSPMETMPGSESL